LEGNEEEELFNMAVIYRQKIKIYFKISKRQATIILLPWVRNI
jgi:hypothetical protein